MKTNLIENAQGELVEYKEGMHLDTSLAPKTLIDCIRSGDRVTIVDRFNKQHTGRAVMRGPAGWVLNMGGRYGTPGIATEENTVNVSPARR